MCKVQNKTKQKKVQYRKLSTAVNWVLKNAVDAALLNPTTELQTHFGGE